MENPGLGKILLIAGLVIAAGLYVTARGVLVEIG